MKFNNQNSKFLVNFDLYLEKKKRICSHKHTFSIDLVLKVQSNDLVEHEQSDRQKDKKKCNRSRIRSQSFGQGSNLMNK